MDLYAYMNIGNIEDVAEANGIKVPRLRGYRLMKNENPVSQKAIEECYERARADVYECACTSIPRFCPESNHFIFDIATDRLRKKYLLYRTESHTDLEGQTTTYKVVSGIRWNLVHGKKRKAIKLAIKHKIKAINAQYHTFNKYAGREDVLMIHARIGGHNWNYYGGPELETQPWFLEKVDDHWDHTYCDIYAKIDPATLSLEIKEDDDDECY